MRPLRIKEVKRTVGRYGDRSRKGQMYVCESGDSILIAWDDDINNSKFEFRLTPEQVLQLDGWLADRLMERVIGSLSKPPPPARPIVSTPPL